MEGEHDHDDFDSFIIDISEQADSNALHQRIIRAAGMFGILRVKGYVRVSGKPMRYLVQAVGTRVNGHFDGACNGSEGRIVVIGRKGLDIAGIQAALTEERLASVG